MCISDSRGVRMMDSVGFMERGWWERDLRLGC
jgi:hypothetical protein